MYITDYTKRLWLYVDQLSNSLKKPEQDNSSCGDLIPRTKQISRLPAAGLKSEGIGTRINMDLSPEKDLVG